MMTLRLLLAFLVAHGPTFAEKKISQLPAQSPASVASGDYLPIVSVASSETRRLLISGLLSVPSLAMVGDSGSGGQAGWCPAPPAGSAAAGKFLKADGLYAVPGASVAPTVQKFTSGSGTYTRPTPSPLYIRVRMVGGGGAGQGSGTASFGSPTSGTATTFGTSLLVANGGSAGGNSGPGGGGTASLGTGPLGAAFTGGYGNAGAFNGTATSPVQVMGGNGGVSPFGGAGYGGAYAGAGSGAVANTGSGGGGGGAGPTNGTYTGGGGGAGGYVDAVITSPAATYPYTVGSGGTGGAAGTSGFAGGSGASGIIIVEEHYQ